MVFFYLVLPFISQSPQPTVLNGSHTLSTTPPCPVAFNNSGTCNYYSNRGHGHGCGQGTPSYSSDYRYSSRPTCQLCHRIGHTAPNCWQRLDHSSAQNSPQAAAFLATANDCPDYQWYHDTGCNHHVTNELENLNVRVDAYNGPNQINGGNGQGLRILRTGTATLPSSIHNFRLSSLLHVPQIEKSYIR
jgi:hypothetical protein